MILKLVLLNLKRDLELTMAELEYKIGVARPLWQRKWWMRCRNVDPVISEMPDGSRLYSACAEFYFPWWAWPLELVHRVKFGNPKLQKI